MRQEKKIVRLLFLGADPTDKGRLRLSNELGQVEEKIRAAGMADFFEIKAAFSIKSSTLSEHLLRNKPHIIHFSGHGEEGGFIFLEKEDGSAQPAAPRDVATIFANAASTTRIAVLNACHSAPLAEAVSRYIPAAIGMDDEISDDAAITFAGSLYTCLCEGLSTQAAFDVARASMSIASGEGDIPVLYSNGVNPQRETIRALPKEIEATHSWMRMGYLMLFVLVCGVFASILLANDDSPVNEDAAGVQHPIDDGTPRKEQPTNAPDTVTLKLRSEPVGARVRIRDTDRKTPLEIKIPRTQGTLRLEVSHSGYFSQVIDLPTDRDNEKFVRLVSNKKSAPRKRGKAKKAEEKNMSLESLYE